MWKKKFIICFLCIMLVTGCVSEKNYQPASSKEENKPVKNSEKEIDNNQETTNISKIDSSHNEQLDTSSEPDSDDDKELKEALSSKEFKSCIENSENYTPNYLLNEGYTYAETVDGEMYFNEYVGYCFLFGGINKIEVYANGSIDLPRDIKIDDTFESVLSLFPQQYDWKMHEYGFIYGEYGETDNPKPAGVVEYDDETGNGLIKLFTDTGYVLIIEFENGVVNVVKFMLVWS